MFPHQIRGEKSENTQTCSTAPMVVAKASDYFQPNITGSQQGEMSRMIDFRISIDR